ncbi:MAG: hypothetical protein ACFFEF_13000 [Candidatus Thorarchaeota archaeon]
MREVRKLLLFVVLLMLFASFQMPVQAHAPGPMTLSYNTETDTLTVQVTHVVTGDHRVAQIQVWKNDVSQIIRLYEPPQETNSGMDDTFTIEAAGGDVLKVTATCSITGSVTEELTVPGGTTSNTTPVNGSSSTWLLIAAVVPVIIVILVILILMKRR